LLRRDCGTAISNGSSVFAASNAITRCLHRKPATVDWDSRASTPATIGKDRVVGILDAGGQAIVYRAVHPTLDKELVIKISRHASPRHCRTAGSVRWWRVHGGHVAREEGDAHPVNGYRNRSRGTGTLRGPNRRMSPAELVIGCQACPNL